MSRASIHEYARAVRVRYQQGGKRERSQLLDEFCTVTGYHRKAAIRLLTRAEPGPPRERRGRPARYDQAVVAALQVVWRASHGSCGKRLVPFMGELVAALERHGELTVTEEVRSALGALSPATVDRLLQPSRQERRGVGLTQSRALTELRAQVPIRSWEEWTAAAPGEVQADLVFHCGETTAGFHLTSLVAVDVATGWTECQPVWGKGQQRVGTALHHIRLRLPVPLQAVHTDNGGEFLNQRLVPYCQREGIRQTRGRPYKKNDQAYVEQKNWRLVRQPIGYDRYATQAAYQQLGVVYQLLRWHTNFFQPVRKLVRKERVGAKVVKHFDRAQTPYQRLLATDVLTEPERRRLAGIYGRLNPLQVLRDLETALERLWTLAEPPLSGERTASGSG